MANAKPKKPTAFQKAQTAYNKAKSTLNKAKKDYSNARSKSDKYEKEYKKAKSATSKAKSKRLYDKWGKTLKATKKRRDKAQKSFDKAEKNYNKQKELKSKAKLNEIADRITEQRNSHRNEGKAAIYPSNGGSGESSVVFISPSDGESESSSVNITSWAVDKGSPRSDHARTSSETKSVAGLITGADRAEALRKYKKLVSWRDNHTELTYDGSFQSGHLLISELGQSFTNLRDNLKVTISFQLVRTAEITHSTGKSRKGKKSKSTKTTQGSRNKKYTAITIKPGDTLLALSRKYGRSVAWLQKVNNIKNPNLIYAGRSLYVSEKQKKLNQKKRVN